MHFLKCISEISGDYLSMVVILFVSHEEEWSIGSLIEVEIS